MAQAEHLLLPDVGTWGGGDVRVRAFCKLLRLPGKGALFRLSASAPGEGDGGRLRVYLPKPVEPAELLAAVARLAERS